MSAVQTAKSKTLFSSNNIPLFLYYGLTTNELLDN